MDKTTSQALSKLQYDPETGVITDGGRIATGKPMPIGYLRLMRGGRSYYAHRLAWRLKTGEWPPAQIDHVNGDRGDNRWANLRLASQAQNNANARVSRRSSLGVKGVTRVGRKFKAQLMVGGVRLYLGLYGSVEDAANAYVNAARLHYGEFARAA